MAKINEKGIKEAPKTGAAAKEDLRSKYSKYLLTDEVPVSEYVIGAYHILSTTERIICLRGFPKTLLSVRYENIINIEHYTRIYWNGLMYAVIFIGFAYYAFASEHTKGFVLGIFDFITSVIPELSEPMSKIDATSFIMLLLVPVLAMFGLLYTFLFFKSFTGSLRISTSTGHIIRITTPFTSDAERLIKNVEENLNKSAGAKPSEEDKNAARAQKERLEEEIRQLELERERLQDAEERIKFDQETLNRRRAELEKEEEGMELLFEEEKKAKKKKSIEEILKSISSGYTYLIKEEHPEVTFKLFAHYTKEGYSGLCITRTNPAQVKEKYKLFGAEIYWLTDTVTDESSIAPNKLEEISVIILDFISGNEKSIILIDGMEYLITKNDYRRTLHFVQHTRDNVSTKDSILLIPLRSAAVEKKELEILEREVELIEP